MKKGFFVLLVPTLSLMVLTVQASSYYQPHIKGAGTISTHTYGEAERLFPFSSSENNLTYINPALRYAKDNSSFESIGLGHRYLSPQNITCLCS